MTQDLKVCFVNLMTQIIMVLALLVGACVPLYAQDLDETNIPPTRVTGRKAVEKYLEFNRLYKERYLQEKRAKAQRRIAKKRVAKKPKRSIAQNSSKRSKKLPARPQSKSIKNVQSKGLAQKQGS